MTLKYIMSKDLTAFECFLRAINRKNYKYLFTIILLKYFNKKPI